MFSIDFHSHTLPGIDDGSKSPEMSNQMITKLFSQGVKLVFATSHFRCHKDEVASFCQKRAYAKRTLSSVMDQKSISRIRLGAEVAIERNLCEVEDIPMLAYENTNCILLELPYRPFAPWMIEEITNVAYEYGMIPVLAHVDRYSQIYSASDYSAIFSIDKAIYQVNNEGFLQRSSRALIKNMIAEDIPFVLGSDCHNMDNRQPNFDIPGKYLKGYRMNQYAESLKEYLLA